MAEVAKVVEKVVEMEEEEMAVELGVVMVKGEAMVAAEKEEVLVEETVVEGKEAGLVVARVEKVVRVVLEVKEVGTVEGTVVVVKGAVTVVVVMVADVEVEMEVVVRVVVVGVVMAEVGKVEEKEAEVTGVVRVVGTVEEREEGKVEEAMEVATVVGKAEAETVEAMVAEMVVVARVEEMVEVTVVVGKAVDTECNPDDNAVVCAHCHTVHKYSKDPYSYSTHQTLRLPIYSFQPHRFGLKRDRLEACLIRLRRSRLLCPDYKSCRCDFPLLLLFV